MQNRIFDKTGVLTQLQSILFDVDGLWQRFRCEEKAISSGYTVLHFRDEIALRQYYEYNIAEKEDQRLILIIDVPDMYIPLDIHHRFYTVYLTYKTVFPALSPIALHKLPGTDWDLLAFCEGLSIHETMDERQTLQYCQHGIYEGELISAYAEKLMVTAEANAHVASGHRDWFAIAQNYGKASSLYASGARISTWKERRNSIENLYATWLTKKYPLLSGTIDRAQPVILNKVADFIRRSSAKPALIVMDGMSFSDLYTLRRALIDAPFNMDVGASFSFFPTVTSVARQSIFSGKLPRENDRPFSLEKEEKQWLDFWIAAGFKAHEIVFNKGILTEIAPYVAVCGIIVKIVDDLMHAELQGRSGMQYGLLEWMKNGRLLKMIKMLLDNGFSVFMTSDHGNTSAIAQGRFVKPGILAEPASRRAVIYDSQFDARELDRFTTEKYAGTYLPDGCSVYLFEPDTCYGDKGKEYITHGGRTLEESIVPFVRIGTHNG